MGGNAVSQVLEGERRYDLVARYLPRYRDTKDAIESIRLLAPSGERVSLAQLCNVKTLDGASEIYREGNSRYVALKYSVRGRDLGSTVEEAISKVNQQVKLPAGYHIDWAGEYESAKRSQKRLAIVLPITLLVIFMILYTMFGSFKWAALLLCNVAMAPVGGLLALCLTGTHFSVSSGVGFLALFGVAVQTGRHHGRIHQSASGARPHDGGFSHRRRRAPAAAHHDDGAGRDPRAASRGHSRGIGSDSQRPFAIVIVGGLMAALLLSIFLLPTIYVWIAGEHDVLPAAEGNLEDV